MAWLCLCFLKWCSSKSGVLEVSARGRAVHRTGKEFSVSPSLIAICILQKNSQLLTAQWPVWSRLVVSISFPRKSLIRVSLFWVSGGEVVQSLHYSLGQGCACQFWLPTDSSSKQKLYCLCFNSMMLWPFVYHKCYNLAALTKMCIANASDATGVLTGGHQRTCPELTVLNELFLPCTWTEEFDQVNSHLLTLLATFSTKEEFYSAAWRHTPREAKAV